MTAQAYCNSIVTILQGPVGTFSLGLDTHFMLLLILHVQVIIIFT